MQMASLNYVLPALAAEETRVVTIARQRGLLEPGPYIFTELFCTDPSCDCRRAMIQVQDGAGSLCATLSYGWESLAFYIAWMHGDVAWARQLPGITLYQGSPQTGKSDELLEVFRQMLSDETYAKRIRTHYALFKQSLGTDVTKSPRITGRRQSPKERRRLMKQIAQGGTRKALPSTNRPGADRGRLD